MYEDDAVLGCIDDVGVVCETFIPTLRGRGREDRDNKHSDNLLLLHNRRAQHEE